MKFLQRLLTAVVLLIIPAFSVSNAQQFVLELTDIKAYFAQQSYPDLKVYVLDNKVFNVLGTVDNNGKVEQINLRFDIEIDPSSRLYEVHSGIFENLPPLKFKFGFTPVQVPGAVDFVGMSYLSSYLDIEELPLNYVPQGMTYQWWKDNSGNTSGGSYEYKELSENRDFKFCVVIRIGTFNENYLIVQYDYTHPMSSKKVDIPDTSLIVGKLIMHSGIGLIKRGEKIIEVTDEALLFFDDYVSIYKNYGDDNYMPSGTVIWTHWYVNGEHVRTPEVVKWNMVGNMAVKMQSLQDDRTFVEKIRGRIWSMVSGTPDRERRVAVGMDCLENACKAALGSRSVYYIDVDDSRMEVKVYEGEVSATLDYTGESVVAKEGEMFEIKSREPGIVKSSFDLQKEISEITDAGIREVIMQNFAMRGITEIPGAENQEAVTEPGNVTSPPVVKSVEFYGIQLTYGGKWEKVSDRDFPQGALLLNDGLSPDGSAFVSAIPENLLEGGPAEIMKMSPSSRRTIDGMNATVYETHVEQENVHVMFIVFDELKHKGSRVVLFAFSPANRWSETSEEVNRLLNSAKAAR